MKTGVLNGNKYLDGDYFYCNPYYVIFYQSFGPVETQKGYPGLWVTLQIIRKVQNIYNKSFIEDFVFSASLLISQLRSTRFTETAVSYLIFMLQNRFLHKKMHRNSAFLMNKVPSLTINDATTIFVKHIGPQNV